MLPAEAVLIKDGKTYVVYVKTGEDLFAPRKVDDRPSIDGKVEIPSGLVESARRSSIKGALLLDGAAEQLL